MKYVGKVVKIDNYRDEPYMYLIYEQASKNPVEVSQRGWKDEFTANMCMESRVEVWNSITKILPTF